MRNQRKMSVPMSFKFYSWRSFEKKRTTWPIALYFLLLELRLFSSMFPLMPKGDIVNINFDSIPLGDYPKYWIDG